MNQIDKDFVYNRFPKTEHDIKLYEDYKAFISLKRKTEAENDLVELLSLFPVYEGTENANGVFVLTRFGFMALSIDDDFMNTCYKPWCSSLLQQDIASDDAQNAIKSGKSPDSVIAMMKKKAKTEDPRTKLEKERDRLTKTINELTTRLEYVEESLANL